LEEQFLSKDGKNSRNVVRVGIDIGGTFTDLLATEGNRRFRKIKVLTTPSDPSIGALAAVRTLVKGDRVDPKLVEVVIHATTLASNALLTGNIPRTALVTTAGFRDVLEIGRQNRPELYNLQVERLPPLVPRRFRFELSERVAYDGQILEPLNVSESVQVARRIKRLGIGSVAICLLHSYANSKHEREVERIIRKIHPTARVSLSTQLLPEFREYERTSTTVVNACLEPLFSNYLKRLEDGLARLGIIAPVLVMQSNSGTVLSSQASVEPARLIESGPVAGAVGAKHYSKGAGNVISLDVGGTTSKAGVWSGRGFELTSEYEVGGRLHGTRRVEGSGYPVRFPMVDLVEVGLGGGSVAWTDDAHVLHVGPQSAGAIPGPACYGKGGIEPTLTDASLVLGRLSSRFLLGGDLILNPEQAFAAISEKVAKSLRLRVVEGALGVLRIAIARIGEALRAATVEKGLDPRGMSLVAFGGAGPMFACEVADQLGIETVVVPPAAGLLSSMGLLIAEPVHDFVKTFLRDASKIDLGEIEEIFREMEKKGWQLLQKEGTERNDVSYRRFLDLRYRGQSYELSVPLRKRVVTNRVVRFAVRDFHRMHQTKYGYSQPKGPIEVVNVRCYCRGKPGTLGKVGSHPSGEKRETETRTVWFADGKAFNCQVLPRDSLKIGFRGRGPVVIEDYDSTLIVPPRARYMAERDGAVSIRL
jgi:N-methylhydantoinase A